MRRPGGYLVSVGPDGTDEHDTFTCCHCNFVTVVKPKEPPGGYCSLCAKLICERCTGKGCDPFEQKLERWERRGQLLRACGL